MFRLLGLHIGPDISTPAAAALAATDTASAHGLLDLLASVHLLEEISSNRYRFHDLLRVYAAERAAAEESDHDRKAAIRRILGWYLHTANAAGGVLIPGNRSIPIDPPQADYAPLAFTTYDAALKWCDAEYANLVAAIRHAAEIGEHTIAWQLPAVLMEFFHLRKSWTDRIATSQIGLTSAHRSHDRFGEAWTLNFLGIAHWDLQQPALAIDYCQRALAIWREVDDRWGLGMALVTLGLGYLDLQRYEEAIDCLHPGLIFCREADDGGSIGAALIGLGNACRELQRSDEATDYYQQALHHFRRTDTRWGEGWTLHELGKAYRSQRRPIEAIDHLQQALAVRRTTGERHGQAQILIDLGDTQREARDYDAARESWRQALAIFEDLQDPRMAEAHARLEST
jgi:tetratricopeptide (TPR) repeat protein